jgi:hypothetical protein
MSFKIPFRQDAGESPDDTIRLLTCTTDQEAHKYSQTPGNHEEERDHDLVHFFKLLYHLPALPNVKV